MTVSFQPPLLARTVDLGATLFRQGYAVLGAGQVAGLADVPLTSLLDWCSRWSDLPPDNYLKDGGRYRRRRHSCFIVDTGKVAMVQHRPHWQPLAYNALHGGMQRHFEPMPQEMTSQPEWESLLAWLGGVADELKGPRAWFAEAHQFRIDTTDGIGRPTPEGAHRDGVNLVAVFLVARHGVKGGETRVFECDGPNGQRFTLSEPWSVLLLDDERVIHESTPIQPLKQDGYRDTLVVTLRSGGFQGES